MSGGSRPARRPQGAAREDRLFVLRPSRKHGQGAFASVLIRRGTRIIEYTGERITHAEADARYDDDAMEQHHTLLMIVNRKWVLDAKPGWPIMFLAPWSSALGLYMGWSKLFEDTSSNIWKTRRFMTEENTSFEKLTGGRAPVDEYIRQRRAGYGLV